MQVNVASEASKGGFAPDAVGAALDTIGTLSHVRIRGLMAIPPEVERPEDVAPLVPSRCARWPTSTGCASDRWG